MSESFTYDEEPFGEGTKVTVIRNHAHGWYEDKELNHYLTNGEVWMIRRKGTSGYVPFAGEVTIR